MASYEVPAKKVEHPIAVASGGDGETERRPSVDIPIHEDWMKELKPGQFHEMTIKGKIKSMHVSKPESDWRGNHLTMDVHHVESHHEQKGEDYSKLADSGFDGSEAKD